MRLAVPLLALLALAGCGSGVEAAQGRTVVAGFYPLAWAAERFVGPHVDVVNLTPPGAEPHDLELSPGDLGTIEDAEPVLYAGGFQPALEDAVASNGVPALDVLPPVEKDPHIWLDPVEFARVVERVAERLGESGSARNTVRALEGSTATTAAAFGAARAACSSRRTLRSGISPTGTP